MPVFKWNPTQIAYHNLETGELTTSGPNTPSGANIVNYSTLSGGTMAERVDAVGAGKKVAFNAGTYEFSDFNDSTDSYGFRVLSTSGVLGSGRDWTTFRMTPLTSTQGARVPVSNPPTSNGQTNPLVLMRIGWEGETTPREGGGFTLEGTNQGHLFSGLELYRVPPGSYFHDILIKGIPGDLSREPGETTSLVFYRVVGATANPVLIDRVEIDGRNSSGVSVAASGVGINFSNDIKFTGLNVHHMAYAHGVAIYESSNVTLTQSSVTDTQLNGVNFENVSGTVVLDRCTFQRNGENHIGIFTNKGSATYTIIDPVYDGTKFRIRNAGYNSLPKTQVQSDIKLYVGGVERPDLIQWFS